MDKSTYNINIIGAGMSGLIAARVLEDHGYSPNVIEATDRPGGRLKTDQIDNMRIDRGFQVLLTAYPMVEKYLDLEALDLKRFRPGAIIYEKGEKTKIGDPIRDLGFLAPTVFSAVGSISDKFKILRLNLELRKKSLESIFEEPETTTAIFLDEYGFSPRIIQSFFTPFFSGIFLEDKLATSSRMFQFVYKMFGSGSAAIPSNGIEAIPKQIVEKLEKTRFQFNSPVSSVKEGEITMENGELKKSDLTIVAVDTPSRLLSMPGQEVAWKSCDALYFKTGSVDFPNDIIGLSAEPDSLVNNIKVDEDGVVCVTIVKDHELPIEEVIRKVRAELITIFQLPTTDFIKHYRIPRALPDLRNIKNDIATTETRINNTIFIAGDTLLNGSLNAAMVSGQQAAKGVVALLEKSPDLSLLTSEYMG